MRILYSPETILKEKHHVRSGLLTAAILGFVSLTICIILCAGVRTADAEIRRLAVIAVSTIAGWGVILLMEGLILPEFREYQHEKGILKGILDASTGRFFQENPEFHTGEIIAIDRIFRIPKSISFFPVTFRDGQEEFHLRLNARYIKDFPPPGTCLHITSIRQYITEYKVVKYE